MPNVLFEILNFHLAPVGIDTYALTNESKSLNINTIENQCALHHATDGIPTNIRR